MDIMVIGGGGREHAIIKKIKRSPNAGTIYSLPGNGGISGGRRLRTNRRQRH